MTYRFPRAARACLRGLVLLLAAPLAGCAVAADDEAGEPVTLPASHQVIEEFDVYVQPRLGLVTITRLSPPQTTAEAAAASNVGGPPGFAPQSETSVNLCQDGTPGTSTPTKCGLAAGTPTVELITDQASIVDTFGTAAVGSCPANSFCASVTLDSFWARSLPYTYVQVTAITDGTGKAMTGHSATNSDATLYGLSNSLGLWSYGSTSAKPPSSAESFIGQAPFNTAARTWIFANPDDANTHVNLRVVAATTFSTYAFQTLLQPYVNACTTGTKLATGLAQSTQALPFPFTLYGTTYDGSTAALAQTVTFSKVGVITLGGTADTTAGGNVKLPSCATTPCASAPKPAIFAFWDNLAYGTGANNKGMCYATGGTAPNRYAAISWNSMRVAGTTATNLTFGAVLHEGTNNINLVYNTMTAGARAGGSNATVGVQNETAKVATATYHSSSYPTNTSKTLVPSP